MNILKLEAEKIYKSFGSGRNSLEVLKGVCAEFEKGKSYAIKGVSGSGKSTLMHILGGLDKPSSGEVLFDHKNIFDLKGRYRENFLNKSLGFVFQFHYLIKELTVLDNIMLMGIIGGDSRKKCEARALELLETINLRDKVNSYPTELSGGQLQRVSILRAIFNKPSFLLADEPTGDLDAENATLITDLLLRYKKDWGMGLIICSHDKNVYEKMENVLMLHDGILR